MKKILFITTHFPPSASVGTQRIVRFIKYLRLRGWDVHVLTLKEKHYGDAGGDLPLQVPDGVRVVRCGQIEVARCWERIKSWWRGKKVGTAGVSPPPGSGARPPPHRRRRSFLFELKELVSRLLYYPDRYNTFSLALYWRAFRLITRHKVPYVFISSPPHSPHLALNFLRRFLRFRYIVDFRDPWARSQWQEKPRHLHEKVERRLDLHFERATIRRADVIIYNTEYLRTHYEEWYPEKSVVIKSYVITNGFDPEAREVVAAAPLNGGARGDGRITLLHTGTLYQKRSPEVIVEGVARFKKAHPELAKRLEIKFIGRVSRDLNHVCDRVKQQGLSSEVAFEPRVPYDEVLAQTRSADWLILLQPGTTIQVPAKLFDYLLVDKPIWGVVEKRSISQKILEELNAGVVSDCASPEAVVAFLRRVTSDRRYTFAPDRKAMESYSIPRLVERLETILLQHPYS